MFYAKYLLLIYDEIKNQKYIDILCKSFGIEYVYF